MHKKPNIFYTINARILLVLLVLFTIVTVVVGVVNNRNIRNLYEESYTDRLLLTNALMGSSIRSEDIEYFIKLMKNQGEDFSRRQVEFYHTREELFELQSAGAPEEEQQAILDRLAEFHAETQAFKNELYWDILDELKELKEISGSTYVYVMADIGLKTRDGETLYTYIFDAEDSGEYSSPDMDGLGTSDTGNEAFTNVFITKRQTEKAELYEGDFGELYFVCVPILNVYGDVTAVLGTDLSLDDMNSAIVTSTAMFNSIIIAVFVIFVLVIFALLSRSIGRPLSSLTQTALVFAEGNLHTPISKTALRQRTEIGTLAQAFKSTLDATTLYLNSIPECLFIMTRGLETNFRNGQFVRRFGDMQAEEFMSALFPDNMKAGLEARLGQEGGTDIAWIDGSCFAVMLKEIVLTGMPENSILVIANDITDLMEEKENAQAAAAAKSAFLSRMSHEMRTPMNAIIGMTKVAGDSDDLLNIRHCISVISSSSEQLLSIINDVLDMSKIEAGKLKLECAPMNIEETIIKVCGLTAATLSKKRQRLNIMLGGDIMPWYTADELRLSQVLTNLLSNAVKFTPEGGTVTLTADVESRNANRDVLRFTVSDTGIGMTELQISRLFNAFEQADGGVARRFGGTGLGLAISQSIVEKMGGEIEVKSTPGAGASFSFTVSLEYAKGQDADDAKSILLGDKSLAIENDADARKYLDEISGRSGNGADSSEVTEDSGTPDLSGVRLLLAEDIDINREVFLALMEGTNVKTDIAENGAEAVSKFRENPGLYDLIIMDIQMPEMDGYEATRTIRAMDVPQAKTIPIVAMSANAFKEDIDRCIECGMNDHLAKPIDVDAVIEKIVRYTGGGK